MSRDRAVTFGYPGLLQDYIGYKSMSDPLFKADKLMLRAQPLVKNGSDDE